MLSHRELTHRIVGLAIEVHRIVGLGVLESVQSKCLAEELEQTSILFQRQVKVPIV
jgi:GxxExxY protein